jgi:hypothetical protein
VPVRARHRRNHHAGGGHGTRVFSLSPHSRLTLLSLFFSACHRRAVASFRRLRVCYVLLACFSLRAILTPQPLLPIPLPKKTTNRIYQLAWTIPKRRRAEGGFVGAERILAQMKVRVEPTRVCGGVGFVFSYLLPRTFSRTLSFSICFSSRTRRVWSSRPPKPSAWVCPSPRARPRARGAPSTRLTAARRCVRLRVPCCADACATSLPPNATNPRLL